MTRILPLTLGYLALIIYGSLLPFELLDVDTSRALRIFLGMPYLDLGLEKRQDLIANGILFFPLALMLSAATTVGSRTSMRLLGAVMGFLIAVAVAAGIEFMQIFFAGRSVSRNDLLSESVGSFAGCLTWGLWGGCLQRAWLSLNRHRTLPPGTALTGYLAVYFAASVMPMDFLVSFDEWKWKFEVSPPVPLLDFAACSSVLHCAFKLPVAFVMTLPLGMLLGVLKRTHPYRSALIQAMTYGLIIGLAVEVAQIATVSGRAEGGSVLARMLAIVMGVVFVRSPLFSNWSTHLRTHARTIVALTVPVYAVLLTIANRWTTHSPASLHAVWQKLETTRLVPFFYHYYSPESAAFVSLLSALAMYAPIGVLIWLWQYSTRAQVDESEFKTCFAFGTLTATLVWVGRLFFNEQPFADPTNVYLAGAIATLTLWALDFWCPTEADRTTNTRSIAQTRIESSFRTTSWASRVTGLLAAMLLIAILIVHPLAALMTGLCVAYSFALIIYPPFWLIAVPCALPLLDFGELTGWTLINEFDLVILNTAAVLAVRQRYSPPSTHVSVRPSVKFLLAALALSYLVSFGRGFFPAVVLDHNALGDYLNPWNAVRVAKGFCAALLLLPFLRAETARDPRAADRFMFGVLLGLLGTGLLVLRERYLFTGIFDLASEFRVAGPFTSMSIGGQHIDAYLAGSLPLAAWFFVRRYGVTMRVLALAALSLGFYAVVATYTRWTYLTVPIVFGVFLAAWIASLRGRRHLGKLLLPATLGIAMTIALLTMSFTDTAFSARLRATSQDAATRIDHWNELLAFARHDLMTELFGEGLGSYPRLQWIWAGMDQRSARVLFPSKGSASFVRLVGGRHLYLDQRVALIERGIYRLEIEARSESELSKLQVVLCEKTVMYSIVCVDKQVQLNSGDAWQKSVATVDIKNIGADLSYLNRVGRRPVFLSIVAPKPGETVDIASVSLRSPSNAELLKNRRFEQGPAHWRITSDDHIAWHTKNVMMNLLFEQGWFGLLTFAALSLRALFVLVVAVRAGHPEGAPLLAGISGMLFVGMTESLLDAPQIAFLYYLCVFYVVGCLSLTDLARQQAR